MWLASRGAQAQAPEPQAPIPASRPPEAVETSVETSSSAPPESPRPAFSLGAYVEAYYQWNFNRPANQITNYRGFDNRHNTFTLANAVLEAQADYENVIARLALQVGSTPSTYYLSEPRRAGSPGANASDLELWKYLQQAYVGYRFVDALTVTAGLFLSPIGPEAMAIRNNWNWSRSDLFFGCPFYHTGARATYAIRGAWAFTLAAYNGWNSVVDNNDQKSISGQLTYTTPRVSSSLLYFGGGEREHGAPEGTPWRHLFDGHVTWNALAWLAFIAHADAGFEDNRFGASRWAAGALYARVQPLKQLFLAARGDFFREHVASNESGRARPIFWPVPWVSSATATLDYRPHERISIRAEYRHDHAGGKLYFGDPLQRNPSSVTDLPNRRAQNTVTLGATAWF